MSIKKGIGYSPLTEKIYLGKQNQEKGMWIGEKEDITSDFINVMFQYIEPNTQRTIRTASGSETNIFFNIKRDKESVEKAIKYFEKLRTELS